MPGGQAVIRVRALTAEEASEVERLTKSRRAEARVVERARIVALARDGKSASAIARELRMSEKMVRQWLLRFNDRGLAGLTDAPRSGRPATYTPEVVGEILSASLIKPQALGLPFGCWTLDRLAAYLREHKGIPIKRNRLDDLLLDEGLRWRCRETWFSEQAKLERPAENALGATPVDRVPSWCVAQKGGDNEALPGAARR